MSSRSPVTHQRDSKRVGWSIWLPLPLALLALATVPAWTRAGIVVFSALVAIHAVWRTPTGAAPGRVVGWAGTLALLAWALSGLAMIPIGATGRTWLQPGLAGPIGDTLQLAGRDLHPIALDPHRALLAWTFAGSMVALGVAAAWVLRSRRRALRLALAVVVSTSGIVLLAWFFRWTHAPSIFWLSGVPAAPREPFFGTFVNPNHAGAALAAALPLSAVLTLRTHTPTRIVGGIGVLLLAAGIWTTGSRGAVIEGALALATLLVLAAPRLIAISTLGTVGVSLGILAGRGVDHSARALGQVLQPTSVMHHALGERPAIWLDTLHLWQAAPFVGVGPGGLRDGMGLTKTLPHYSMPVHAHCEPLQALAEHGVGVGLLWWAAIVLPILAAVYRLRRLHRGRRRTLGAALVGSVVALGVAGLFDFPLRIGALAVFSALLLGALASFAGRDSPPMAGTPQRALKVGVTIAALVGLGFPLRLLLDGGDGMFADTQPLEDATAQVWHQAREAEDPDALYERVAQAGRIQSGRRPAWHHGPMQIARAETALGHTDQALHALEVATEIYPTLPAPWLGLARLRAGAGDAAGSCSDWRHFLALNLPNNDDDSAYIGQALRCMPNPERAAEMAIPDRPDRQRDAAVTLSRQGLQPAARRLFELSVAKDRRYNLAYSRHLLRWGEPERAWESLILVPDRNCGTLTTGARILLALGRTVEAQQWAERATARCDGGDLLAQDILARALAARRDERAVPLLEALVEARPDDTDLRRLLILAYQHAGQSPAQIPHLEALLLDGVATTAEANRLLVLVGVPPVQ